MSHFMNGRPIWCPPARTRDQALPEAATPETPVTLREAATLVRAAIKRGLIKIEAPEPAVKPGPRSVVTQCAKCGVQFSRYHLSPQTFCETCRLTKKNCTMCGCEFQPLQKKQKICGKSCRQQQLHAVASKLTKERVTTVCAWCGKSFQKRISQPKKTNCSRECGYRSMAAKIRKPTT